MIIFSGNVCSGKSNRLCKFINDNIDKSFAILSLDNTIEFYRERINSNCEVNVFESNQWTNNEFQDVANIIRDYNKLIENYNLEFDYVVVDFISLRNTGKLIKYIRNEIEAEPIILIQDPYKN